MVEVMYIHRYISTPRVDVFLYSLNEPAFLVQPFHTIRNSRIMVTLVLRYKFVKHPGLSAIGGAVVVIVITMSYCNFSYTTSD